MKRFTFILFAVTLAFALARHLSLGPADATADSPQVVTASHLESIDPDAVDWKSKDDPYWKSVLTKPQYEVCRAGGTERPFSGVYNDFKGKGAFVCSSCGLPLFASDTKFDSGTGWPSFTSPIGDNVELRKDFTFGLFRTEVVCKRCGAHLGHVFDDGPKPTGLRYCINSVCLLFRDSAGLAPSPKGDGSIPGSPEK